MQVAGSLTHGSLVEEFKKKRGSFICITGVVAGVFGWVWRSWLAGLAENCMQ